MKRVAMWVLVGVLVSVTTQTAFCADIVVNSYPLAGLPAPGTAGRIARVSDDVRGLWMDQGSQWFGINGETVNVVDFGATGNGTDDTDEIQNAINALPTTGGTVLIPPGTYFITSPGLSLKDGVRLTGASPYASRLTICGSWTDSVIKAARRDDNNPDHFEKVIVENLSFQMASPSSGFALLDLTGMRGSKFENLYLNGGGYGSGQTAILLSDRNPTGLSHKSTFFNSLIDIDGTGAGWGTWIKFRQFYGDCNSNLFIQHNAGARKGIDFTEAANFSGNVTLMQFYLAGDMTAGESVITNNMIPTETNLIKINPEGYAVLTPHIHNFYQSGTTQSGSFFNRIKTGGLSATDTMAQNLRGSVSFNNSQTSRTVIFERDEPDANYFITLGASTAKAFSVTGKSTTGFTINKSTSGEASNVDWHLIR